MSSQVGSYDAKTKLPELLRQVADGQRFTITNRGNAVAELSPAFDAERQKAKTAIDNLMQMSKVTVSDEQLAALRQDGGK